MGVKLTMGCLGEGPKEGKGRHQARSGRSENGKWRGGINRRGQSHRDWLLVSVWVWLSPAPDYHHLSWPRIKLILAVSSARMRICDLLANCKLDEPISRIRGPRARYRADHKSEDPLPAIHGRVCA